MTGPVADHVTPDSGSTMRSRDLRGTLAPDPRRDRRAEAPGFVEGPLRVTGEWCPPLPCRRRASGALERGGARPYRGYPGKTGNSAWPPARAAFLPPSSGLREPMPLAALSPSGLLVSRAVLKKVGRCVRHLADGGHGPCPSARHEREGWLWRTSRTGSRPTATSQGPARAVGSGEGGRRLTRAFHRPR